MNLIKKYSLIICLISFASCMSQNQLELSYKAQTRGYLLEINVVEKSISITENSITSKFKLSNSNFKELTSKIKDIDFSNLIIEDKSEEIAVDRAIPALFYLKTDKSEYTLELTHKTNEKIQSLIDLIQSFANKE